MSIEVHLIAGDASDEEVNAMIDAIFAEDEADDGADETTEDKGAE